MASPSIVLLTTALAAARDHLAYVLVIGASVSGRARLLRMAIQQWQGPQETVRFDPDDEQGSREAFGRALSTGTEPAGAREPLLVLEDLHWADEETIARLDRLAREEASVPRAIVATLELENARPQVRELLGTVARAGLLHEIRVDVESPRAALTPGNDDLGLGADALEGLGRDTRYLLSLAALLGSPFSLRMLCVVSGQGMTQLLPVVGEALDVNVLVPGGPSELAFASEGVRQALLTRLPPAVLAELHRDIAKRLEVAGSPARVIADHMRHMTWLPGDLDWISRIARQLLRDDAGSAVLLWRRMASSLDRHDPRWASVKGELARAELAAGQLSHAEQTVRTSLGMTSNSDQAGPLLVSLSAALYRQRRWTEAQRSAEEASTAPGLTAADRAEQIAVSGAAALLGGNIDRALECVARAERVASLVGASRARMRSMMVRGRLAYQRGALSVAEDYLRRAVALGGAENDAEVFDAGPHALYALLLADMDRFNEAKAVLDVGRDGSQRLGAAMGLHITLVADGALAHDQGDVAVATEALDRGLAVLEDGAGLLFPLGVARRAVLSLHTLGHSAAEGWLRRLPDGGDVSVAGGWSYFARALFLRRSDRHAEAYDVLREGWRLLGERHLESELMVLGSEVADAAWLAGDRELARESATALAQLARQNEGIPTLRGLADAAHALAGSNPAELQAAAVAWRSSTRILQAARITEQIAHRLSYLGAAGAAAEEAKQAAGLYSRAGAWADARLVQEQFGDGFGQGDEPHVAPGRSGWDALTRTERTVADYVEQGLSNREIAGAMVVSRRTVETHVSHVLAKLGLRSRAELVLAAAQRARIPEQPEPFSRSCDSQPQRGRSPRTQ